MDLEQQARVFLAQAKRAAENAKNAQGLNAAFQEYLGRRGLLRDLLRNVGSIPELDRPRVGRAVHIAVAAAEEAFSQKLRELEAHEDAHVLAHERLDVTIPGKKVHRGRLHVLN